MRSSFSISLLYHAYVYLEFLILACTIYILAPTLIAEENGHAVKTRVPGTWGKNVRYVWLRKENIMDIHNGKTMLTFLDTSKDYKLYDE